MIEATIISIIQILSNKNLIFQQEDLPFILSIITICPPPLTLSTSITKLRVLRPLNLSIPSINMTPSLQEEVFPFSFLVVFFFLTPFFLFFPPVNFSINNMNTFTPPTPRNPPPPGVNPLRKAVPMTNVFFTNFIFFLFFHSYLYFSIILKVNPKKNIYISNYTTFQ